MTYIAWIDVETTGLDPNTDRLLEIACLVTDNELNVLDENGYHAVFRYDKRWAGRLRAQSWETVREMHDKTGLWEKLSGPDAKPKAQIDQELTAYLHSFEPAPAAMPIGGNSVHFDRGFITVHLPEVASHLSHRLRDVSTMGGFLRDWGIVTEFEKFNDHTAMRDIRESIREAKYYRDLILAQAIPVSETREGTP